MRGVRTCVRVSGTLLAAVALAFQPEGLSWTNMRMVADLAAQAASLPSPWLAIDLGSPDPGRYIVIRSRSSTSQSVATAPEARRTISTSSINRSPGTSK